MMMMMMKGDAPSSYHSSPSQILIRATRLGFGMLIRATPVIGIVVWWLSANLVELMIFEIVYLGMLL